MAEATIDELQIEIESDGADAAQALEKLQQTLERLAAPVQALTTGNGLNKLTKQLEKLAEAGRAISSLSGLDKITQTANALKSLDALTGAPKIGSYISALNKLSQASGAVQAIAAFPDVTAQLTALSGALSALGGLGGAAPDVGGYVKALNKLSQAGTAIQTIAGFPDITVQLTALTNALNSMRNIQDIRLTPLINSLERLPAAVQAINSMPAVDTSRIRSLNRAISALKTGNAQKIGQFANAVNKLPTAAQRINQIDFTQFSNSIQQLMTTLEPLIQRAEQASEGLTALARVMRAASRQSSNSNGLGGLGGTLGTLSTKSLLSWASLLKLKKVLGECFNVSAQYVENLNLFNVTMGKSASSAFEFAEAVNAALGVDTSDWIRYQGFFQSVGKGFGVVSEKADLMSKNLTQLAYDISSFYNISTEEAYNKVQSGFAGELEPLRRLGFALDEATLKQLAYSKGITQTYESMTQAQKSQLRYVAMIEQAQNIGVTGDMSRTIDTASNGVRVLEARIQQFTRALGNMLMPVLSALLPYFTAFVQVLTEAANGIANFLGFELPKIDLSGVSNGYDDIAGAADEATAATEKFKGSLAGVDQLNIIGSHTNKSGSGTGYSTDLDIELPTYDFLNGVESKTKEIAENIKGWFKEALPWIEAVGVAVGSVFATTSLVTFGSKLGGVIASIRKFNAALGDTGAKKFWGVTGALAAGASSGVLLYNSIKNLIKGTGDLANNWVQLGAGIGIAGTAIGLFAAAGNPIGAIVTAVGLLAGAFIGCTTAVQELTDETYKSVFYSDVGTSIQEVADKYTAWTDEITKTDDKVAENQQAIENNKKTIEGSLDTLEDLAKSFEASGNMSEEAAGKIKEASESITSSISSNLTTELNNIILGIGESWDVVAEKAGMAKDEILNALYAENNQGNEALTALQKKISSATETLAAAKKGSAEYNSALEDYNSALAQIEKVSNAAVGSNSKEYIDQQLSALSYDKIALMDANTAKSALEQISNSYNTAVEKMSTTKESALSNLKTRNATLEALGIDTNSTIYESVAKGIQSEYETRLGDLTGKTMEVAEMLNRRVKELDSSAGTQALDKFYGRLNWNYFDGAQNAGDVLANYLSQAGASVEYANAWWRTMLGGGRDVNQTLRNDYAERNGTSDIAKSVDDLMSDIEATAVINVTQELKGAGPQMGYASSSISEAVNEAVVNSQPDSGSSDTPPVIVNVNMDSDEIASYMVDIHGQQVTAYNGR